MSIKTGRIGKQEAVSITAVSLAAEGLFTAESRGLYKTGNCSYLTVPAALFISAMIALIVLRAMKKRGADSFVKLLTVSFGRFAVVPGAVVFIMLIFSAYLPTSEFVFAMHGLVFEGVSYERLVLFILPAVFILCVFGFETIARTAKCVAPLLIAVLAASILSASSEFRIYRLFPFPGKAPGEIITELFRLIGAFLPTVTAFLIVSDGMNDMKTAESALRTAAIAAGAICFAAQLAVSLVYTFAGLEKVYMPLFRLNHLNLFEAHLMRLDKLAHMIWLGGSIVAAAFHAFAASKLAAELFSMKDVRPTAAAAVLLTAILILIDADGGNETFGILKAFIVDNGTWILAVPILAAALAAAKKGVLLEKKA